MPAAAVGVVNVEASAVIMHKLRQETVGIDIDNADEDGNDE